MVKNLKTKLLSLLMVGTIFVTGCGSKDKQNIEKLNTPNEAIITYLNTGNSDAILVEQGDKNLLIDSGDNDDEKFMVDYLKKENIDKIDYFLLTHFDADHIGGADKIIDNIEVGKIFVPNGDADTKTYRDFIKSTSDKGVYPSVPLEGAKFELGNVYFQIFNTKGGVNRNDDSLIVKMTNGKDTFAFMGDAGKEIEKRVASKIGDVDVLKAGHHGSHTSSGYDFVKAISPEYAIVMCGVDNRYGHPHKEVVDTFKEFGVKVHRSDECGDIVFTSTGNGVYTNCKDGSYKVGTNSKYSEKEEYTNETITEEVVKDSTDVVQNNAKTVYWTPNGEVYHLTEDCHTLSKSKVINQGSISESEKPRAHKNCK
ncbi:MAG: ComEC/Rec2 family competence protein [Romboutsia sp.]